jgi:hypothetical protein
MPWVVGVALIVIGTGCDRPPDPTLTSTPGFTLPALPTPPPPTPQPTEDNTAIVVYRVLGGNARPVDVTFTGEDGAPVSVLGAAPGTWSKGGFWPVGISISLSATTGDAGNSDFSCEITMGGTRQSGAAKAQLEGNDIVGWECEVGPVVVESVL